MASTAAALRYLARQAPGFHARWTKRFRRMPLPFVGVAELVQYLGADALQREELQRVLFAAEELFVSAGHSTVNLLIVGLLEGLQNLASFPETAITVTDVEPMLPPRCAVEWEALDARWIAVWTSIAGQPPAIDLERYMELSDPVVRNMFRTNYRVMPDGRFVGVADVLRWEVETSS